jgi:uncharacterized membrane protein
VLFVDLARVIAILLMIQGHTMDALLRPEYRQTTAFHAWSFFRGLTSCLFFFLAGFAFALAHFRTREEVIFSEYPRLRRFGRLAILLVIGYGLHSPIAKLEHLSLVTADVWRAFLAVDALQCVAITLALLQVLALGARTRRRFLVLSLIGCVLVVAMTPITWRISWQTLLPDAVAAYLTPHTGSLFPLFPWSAYGLLGAAVGAAYIGSTDPVRFSISTLIASGAAMLTAALIGSLSAWEPLGRTEFWSSSPNQFLLRAGLVCLGIAAVAHISKRISRLPAGLSALARNSLPVYVLHLCIVYGSAWNRGLVALFGYTLAPAPAFAWVIVLWTSVTAFAYYWHSSRAHRARTAQWITQATSVGLIDRLF